MYWFYESFRNHEPWIPRDRNSDRWYVLHWDAVGFVDKVTVKKEGKYGTSNDVCMYTGTEDMKRK